MTTDRAQWNRDWKHLQATLPLLLESGDLLSTHPRCYASAPLPALVSCQGRGGGRLPLGGLVELWDSGGFHTSCPACGSRLYIVNVWADDRTHEHILTGVCVSCPDPQTTIFASRSEYGKVWDALYEARLWRDRQPPGSEKVWPHGAPPLASAIRCLRASARRRCRDDLPRDPSDGLDLPLFGGRGT